jgi:hypothetical protein
MSRLWRKSPPEPGLRKAIAATMFAGEPLL